MSQVVKIAVLAALMATLNGRAYAAPVNIDFNSGTFAGWTVVTGVDGFANIVTNAPSRRDLNTNPLSNVGDPADWISPLTNANTPSCSITSGIAGCTPGGGNFAFLEPGPIPGSTSSGSNPNIYTSIVSDDFVADPFATLSLWAFFDALDQQTGAGATWNDDGYARLFNVTTNSLVGPVYTQSNTTMLCNQGSDASRWPHNSFPYLPSNCVQPFLGAMQYALVAGNTYRVEAGVRNGSGGTNDNSIPASLGLEALYTLNQRDPGDPVPEPGTLALFGSGLGIALAAYRRRSSKA